jgi:hypothetical protein
LIYFIIVFVYRALHPPDSDRRPFLRLYTMISKVPKEHEELEVGAAKQEAPEEPEVSATEQEAAWLYLMNIFLSSNNNCCTTHR